MPQANPPSAEITGDEMSGNGRFSTELANTQFFADCSAMNKIPSHVARRQAEICLALVQEIDQAVVNSRQPADQVLAGLYRQHRDYGARDRRFFSNAVFSWFRWRGWLKTPTNENIAAAILLDAPEIPPPIEYMIQPSKLCQRQLETLRPCPGFAIGSAEASSGQAVAGLAEAQASPKAPPRRAGPGSTPPATILEFLDINLTPSNLKPLGPLNLDDKAASLRELLKGDRRRIEQLAPDWVSDFLFIPSDCNPEAHLRQCLESFQTRPPTWLRLRSDQILRLINLLTQMKIETGTHPFIKQAVFIKGPKNCDLSQLPGAEAQDLASQCVGICCNPKPGEQWWDVCAGSGGKSFHLADLMTGKGSILATDTRAGILQEFRRRLERNRITGITVRLWDGTQATAPERQFDGVLLDAPCSGIGTWHRNPDARWRAAPDTVPSHAALQSALLKTCAKQVRPGGRLVYAVCTVTRAETADVIEGFLAGRQDFRLEPTAHPLSGNPTPGLIWIWPWESECNGMFIACLTKR